MNFSGGLPLKSGKKCVSILAASALALSLAGCGAGTNQGARTNAIAVVREAQRAEYGLATARRGALSLTESVRVTYFAAREAAYGFGVSGVYYENFSVAVGDQVQAGDVLATLESAQLDAEYDDCLARIDALARERERNAALLHLLDARLAQRAEMAGAQAADDARRREYEVAIRAAEDETELIHVRLSELDAQRAGRVICAAFDGTVTFVRDAQPGELSVKGRTVVEVTDLESCAFSATVEHPGALPFGETFAVQIDGAEYAIQRTTADALGIEDAPANESSTRTKVYFAPLVPSVNLKDGSAGRFSVTVDTREDALQVPIGAVAEIGGETCVYALDENGLKYARPVTLGLVTAHSCEILDGLSEGETVVLY
jgi:HlyD family secretion protein